MGRISESCIRIGFLVNPIAGMGGRVALKGTDGQFAEAVRRGATPVSIFRATTALQSMRDLPVLFFTCSGEMGENAFRESGIKDYRIICRCPSRSSAEDTRRACHDFMNEGVSLILFCGGDGTARDVFSVVEDHIPILGIPAGVKMYSAVFGVNPVACAEIVTHLNEAVLRDSEVVDVDEEAYRSGVLATRVYGFARVPVLPLKAQIGKQVFEEPDEELAKKAIALFFSEILCDDTLYILGAGTTTAEIASSLGIEKTLLGIDVIKGKALLARDADERTLLSFLSHGEKAKIVVSPLGAQGFIFGRGTQTVSPAVLNQVGVENVIVVATPHKLQETRVLYVDTGDEALDQAFGDSVLVISGYRMGQRKKVLHPTTSNQGAPKH